MEQASPNYQESCELIPINLHEASEFEDLIRQRKACGWNYTQKVIGEWRDHMDSKEKTLFWITLPSRQGARAGHISLDSLEHSPEPEIRNSDKSIMTIKTFFILSEYRSLGIGRTCMDILEDWATKHPFGSPNCRSIVVDTICKKYYQDPQWQEEIERLFPHINSEKRLRAQLWYERRGYVQFKEGPRYQETTESGEVVPLVAAFLRKDLD